VKSIDLILVLSAVCVLGQGLQPSTDGAVYPPLAKQARIQGTVKFAMSVAQGNASITLISGHPILIAGARGALEKWPFDAVADGEYRVTYVYQLDDEADFDVVRVTRKRGNALDRFFLRAFRRPTTVNQKECGPPKAAEVTTRAETVDGFPGATVVVHAHGGTCVQW